MFFVIFSLGIINLVQQIFDALCRVRLIVTIAVCLCAELEIAPALRAMQGNYALRRSYNEFLG